MTKKRFNDKEEEEIILQWTEGKNTSELGEKYNCHRETIRSVLIRHGLNTER